MLNLLLDYHIIIIGGILAVYYLYQLKKEYFPKEPRYSEKLLEHYVAVRIDRRYVCQTSKYLKTLKIPTQS